MAKRYQMTARRRAALRKAQLASARKRSRNKKIKTGAAIAAVGAGAIGLGVARHKLSGSSFSTKHHPIVSQRTGNLTGSHARSLFNSRHTSNSNGKRKTTGRSIGVTTAKRGPLGSSKTVSYEHKKLTKTVIGNKIKATPIGNRLAYKTRALRKKENPYAALYKPKSPFSYGAYGKRVPRVDSVIKSRGGKQVS